MKIQHLMILVALLAVLLAMPREWYGPSAMVLFPPACLLMAHRIVKRGYRQLAMIGFLVVGIAINVAYAVFCIMPDRYLLLALAIAWPILVAPAILGLGVPWTILSARGSPERRHANPVPGLLVLAMLVFPLLTLGTHWPLRLAFLAARPALARLARGGGYSSFQSAPQRAGLFRIREKHVDGTGNDVLILDTYYLGQGFMIHSRFRAPAASVVSVNGPCRVVLDDRWFYMDQEK